MVQYNVQGTAIDVQRRDVASRDHTKKTTAATATATIKTQVSKRNSQNTTQPLWCHHNLRENNTFSSYFHISSFLIDIMYNGIGLTSVRGTATSGHVQANRSHVRNNRVRRQREKNVSQGQQHQSYNPVSATAREKGNIDIQQHDEKRRIENDLLELRLELEESDKKYTDEEIDSKIQKERERRLQQLKDASERQRQQKQQQQQQRQEGNNNRSSGGDRGRGNDLLSRRPSW